MIIEIIIPVILFQTTPTPPVPSSSDIGWGTLLPVLNGIVGGTVMALVAWLVGTGKLVLGREYEALKERAADKKKTINELTEDRDKLVEDLRHNNEVLIKSAEAVTKANAALAEANKQLEYILKNRQQ